MPSDEQRRHYQMMLTEAVEGLLEEGEDKDDIVDQVIGDADDWAQVQEESG
jgi:hypothetical protein